MKRLFFFPILFFILVFEGIALKLLPEMLINTNLLIVPHWVFIFLVLIALFYDHSTTYYSIIYACLFGLLVDIVYTNILGVYMFTYPVAIYVIQLLKGVFHTNIYTAILMTTVGLCVTEIIIHFIYLTVDITHMPFVDHFVYRLLPTILANLILLIILYPLLKNILQRLSFTSK